MTNQVKRLYRRFRGCTGVVGEDAKRSLRMAKAHVQAEAMGLEFVWEEDCDISVDDFDDERDREHVRSDGARCCRLVRPCEDHGLECRHAETLASLGGILRAFLLQSNLGRL